MKRLNELKNLGIKTMIITLIVSVMMPSTVFAGTKVKVAAGLTATTAVGLGVANAAVIATSAAGTAGAGGLIGLAGASGGGLAAGVTAGSVAGALFWPLGAVLGAGAVIGLLGWGGYKLYHHVKRQKQDRVMFGGVYSQALSEDDMQIKLYPAAQRACAALSYGLKSANKFTPNFIPQPIVKSTYALPLDTDRIVSKNYKSYPMPRDGYANWVITSLDCEATPQQRAQASVTTDLGQGVTDLTYGTMMSNGSARQFASDPRSSGNIDKAALLSQFAAYSQSADGRQSVMAY